VPFWRNCCCRSYAAHLLLWVSFSAVIPAAILAQDDGGLVHIVPQASSRKLAAPWSQAGERFFRSNAELVLVPLSVTDSMDRMVLGLEKDNFKIYENKQLQTIQSISTEDAPISVGLILDTSGSMKTKVERTRQAIMEFIKGANRDDEFFLITFSDSPIEKVDFTNSTELIDNALAYWTPRGRTALLDAIYLGLTKMRRAKYPRRALLIVSDGGDNHSRYSESELRNLVKESDVMVYAIGIYDHYFASEEERLGPGLLEDVTEKSGGHTFTIDDPRDLSTAVNMIGLALRNLYVLCYRPTNTERDGRWHTIKVALARPKGFPQLHVHAKKGYYASPE
jgi:Ca-activated chloride channel family protein